MVFKRQFKHTFIETYFYSCAKDISAKVEILLLHRCVTRIGESTCTECVCFWVAPKALETQLFLLIFIYFYVLGFCCWVWAFWLLRAEAILCLLCSGFPAVASLVAKHELYGTGVSVVVAHRLSCPTARGIFLIRDWTRVPRTPAPNTPQPLTTREAQKNPAFEYLILRYISCNDLIILPCDF